MSMKGGPWILMSVDPAILKSAWGVPAVGTYNFGNALNLFAYDKITSPKIVKGKKTSLIDDALR